MKIFTILLLILGIQYTTSLAQKEITYTNPPAILGDGYTLEVDDIISTESACKLRMVIKNMSPDAYLVYRLQNSGFSFDQLGKFYEKKQKGEVIGPLKKDGIVVKVVGNDYRRPTFQFHPEGLFMASVKVDAVQPTAFALKPGTIDQSNLNGVNISLLSVTDKKGVMNVTFEVSLESAKNNSLLILDPAQLQLINTEGQLVESDLKKNKVVGLLAGESKKISFTYPSTEMVSIKWNNTLKVSPLVGVDVEPIRIIDQTVAVVNEDKCGPFRGQQQGSVNVVLQGGTGICFKLDINGFPVVTDFASAASFAVNPGRQKMVFTFPNGTVVEESSIINNWYSSVGFNVVKKKNGSYAVRYDVFAQVLSPAGEEQRAAMMTKVTTSSSVSSSNSGTTTTTTTTTSNSGGSSSSCFGEASSGASSVRIKVTWNGNPVINHAIRIKQGGSVLGVGNTDNSGTAKIFTSSLNHPQIDVEGCSGSKSWSVSGSYCVLDSSGYLELPLDVIAREMGNLLGLTLEEIGSSWGF